MVDVVVSIVECEDVCHDVDGCDVDQGRKVKWESSRRRAKNARTAQPQSEAEVNDCAVLPFTYIRLLSELTRCRHNFMGLKK